MCDDCGVTVDRELVGERVQLRTTVEQDRARIIEIRKTPEVMARWRGDDLESEFDQALNDDEAHQFCIRLIGDESIVGLIQFGEEEEPDYRSASIDIFLDPAVHRRGLGVDAIRTLVRYLLEEAGHHRVTIDPAADNAAAIGCYAKVGFRPVGIMSQYERQSDGTWADGLLMELLADDWVAADSKE